MFMNKLMLSILIFLILFASSSLQAQEGAPVLLTVVYKTVHVNDTNHRDTPLVEDMMLQLAQTHSRYLRLYVKPKPVSTQATGGATIVAVGRPLAVVNGPGITDIELYQYPAEKKLNTTASLGMADYLMEQDLPVIKWTISQDTKEIGGYKCQKATGRFAGRTYTAWFTSDLPFQNGPCGCL